MELFNAKYILGVIGTLSNSTKIQYRIDNPVNIDYSQIEVELNNNKEVIVQFSNDTYNGEMLSKLNELCIRHNSDLSIRFYGHYQTLFDCNVLEEIPNVKSLYIDCLRKVQNIKSLSALSYLERLSIGIYEMNEKEILGLSNLKKLRILILSDTKTKAINLEYLREYHNLNSLAVCGHLKNIEAIGEITNLEHLYLSMISKVSLEFVNRLKNLKTLQLILGGRENINEIEESEIETLSIIRVRGLKDLSNISKFKKLKQLLVEDQAQLSEIKFDDILRDLNDIRILNCKSFNSLIGLENLPTLHQLRISKTNIDFQSFVKQNRPQSLKVFAFYTDRIKVDNEIKEELMALGYSER